MPADFAVRYDALILNPLMRRYYGSTGYYNTGYWTEETRTQADASEALVARLLRTVPAAGADVLDIACGLGATTRSIVRRWPDSRVAAVNLSVPQLKVAKRRAPGCGMCAMDGARLAFADGSFDVLVCVEAAFHFETRQSFLREARRILRPGGWLVMSDILFAAGGWAGAWTVPAKNYVVDLDAYARGVSDAGLELVSLEDATQPCWTAYCRELGHWLDGERDEGNLPARDHAMWSAIVTGLGRGAVNYYLLVAARRPAAH